MKRGLRTIFLALFTGVAGLFAVAIAVDWVQGVSTWFWEETTCTIQTAGVTGSGLDDGFELLVEYEYRFRGETHRGTEYRHDGASFRSLASARRAMHRFEPESRHPCWVNPDDPGEAYLVRANLWRGLWILLPLALVGVGLGLARFIRAMEDPTSRTAKQTVSGPTLILVFFGVFFLFGIGFFIPFFLQPALRVVEARSWEPVPCRILTSDVRTHAGDDGATYSIEVTYRYRYDGREYVSDRYQFMGGSSSGYDRKARLVAEIPEGSRATCWVDPDDPFEAVLDRGWGVDFLFGLIPLVFVAVGAGGLAFGLHHFRSSRKEAGRAHWSPPAATRLSHGGGPLELEPVWGPVGKLGCATFFALVWNGITSVFVWIVVKSFRDGDPEWFVAVLITPFVLIGLLLLSGIPYGLLALLNPKPRLRLSSATIPVGGSAQIDWSFRGDARRLRRLRIWLEASERVTRRSTSSISVETRKIEDSRIDVLDYADDRPLAFGSVTVHIPAGTRPTSEDEPATTWKLKLHASIDRWPDVQEEYEIGIDGSETR